MVFFFQVLHVTIFQGEKERERERVKELRKFQSGGNYQLVVTYYYNERNCDVINGSGK